MRIDRLGSSTQDYAKGLLTPWFRAVCHLSFAGALISINEDMTDDILTDVITDMDEALKHLEERLEADTSSAFLSLSTINTGDHLANQLQEYTELELRNKTAAGVNRADVLANIQNLIHNAAYLASRAEQEMHGTDSEPGRLL